MFLLKYFNQKNKLNSQLKELHPQSSGGNTLRRKYIRRCISVPRWQRGRKRRERSGLEHKVTHSFKGREESEVSDTHQNIGWKPAENQDPAEVSWLMKARASHPSAPSPWTPFSSSFVIFFPPQHRVFYLGFFLLFSPLIHHLLLLYHRPSLTLLLCPRPTVKEAI